MAECLLSIKSDGCSKPTERACASILSYWKGSDLGLKKTGVSKTYGEKHSRELFQVPREFLDGTTKTGNNILGQCSIITGNDERMSRLFVDWCQWTSANLKKKTQSNAFFTILFYRSLNLYFKKYNNVIKTYSSVSGLTYPWQEGATQSYLARDFAGKSQKSSKDRYTAFIWKRTRKLETAVYYLYENYADDEATYFSVVRAFDEWKLYFYSADLASG